LGSSKSCTNLWNYDGFKIFREYCKKLICKKPTLFFESQDFVLTEKSTLISVIKRDVLDIEEIEIWNNVIKRGIKQEPQLNTNLLELTPEDLNELRTCIITYSIFSYIWEWFLRKDMAVKDDSFKRSY
jgi:hypothetical protein